MSVRRPGIIVIASMLIVTACSHDPLQSYLDGMVDVTRHMAEDSIAALPPRSAITRSQVTEVLDIRRRALERIDGLAPDSEIAPEHTAFRDAFSDLVNASAAFLDSTKDLDPTAFQDAVLAATNLDRLADRVTIACALLERRSAELGVPADLAC